MTIATSPIRFEDVSNTPFDGATLVTWWGSLVVKSPLPHTPIRQILDASYTKDIPRRTSMEITDSSLHMAFFDEAMDYYAKGVLSSYGAHVMLRHDFRSWALISAYYSSFYTVNCLLRVQGRAIVHSRKSPSELYWLCPSDSSEAKFLVVNKHEGRGEHMHHWTFFYNVYRKFKPVITTFEPIVRDDYFGPDEREESAIRNDRTYFPFLFEETDDVWKETAETFWQRVSLLDENLESKVSLLCSDDEHKYFARAALRLLFARRLLESIVGSGSLRQILRAKLDHLYKMKQMLVPPADLREHSVAWSLANTLQPPAQAWPEGSESSST